MDNLFRHVPDSLPQERLETLIDKGSVRVERIVSAGHSGPADGWYDQDRSEWVVVLKGAARLLFDDGCEVSMGPGDWIDIPAHCRHRVLWTDPETPTVWLAVHYEA